MKNWIFLLSIFIIAVFQATILDVFKIFNVKPDILLVAVVVSSIYLDLKWALVLAVFAGILKDSLNLHSFAINTLILTVFSFLTVKISKKISLDNNFICSLLLFIIVVSNGIIIRLSYFSGDQFIPLGIFLRTLFLESLYAIAILPLVYKLLKQVLYV